MSNTRTNERVAGLSLSMATLGRNGPPAWEPNWIDYRSSVANVERRADRGDTSETCSECGCEIDITPEPHSPKCPTLVQVSVEHGRELLDRMDAGEPLTDEPELEEAAAVGERAESGAAPLLVGEPERAAVSSSSSRSGRGPKWTRESVIAAIREVAERVDHTPTHAEMKAAGYSSAGVNTTLRRIGATWAELVREAGYEPNTRAARAARPAPAARNGNTAARPDADHGRARAWTPEDVLAAIRRWNGEYGHPPTSTEWMRRVDGYPTTTTVASRFGSWANAIEQAGFDRPTRGGVPLKPLATPPKRVRVRSTGLTYRSAEEAYLAAEEIESDGERVAEQARFDANEAKAEQAIDQSRELAEKIRDAAHAFEARHSAESEREPEATDPAEAEVAPSRRALLAAEGATSRSDVLLRAVALAARAFADAILEETA